MNSNVQMKQETRPWAIRRTFTWFIDGATPSQRLRVTIVHLSQLHPSPPISQPSPVEPSLVPPIHSTENSQEPKKVWELKGQPLVLAGDKCAKSNLSLEQKPGNQADCNLKGQRQPKHRNPRELIPGYQRDRCRDW